MYPHSPKQQKKKTSHNAEPVRRRRPREGRVGVVVDVLEELVVHVLVHEGALDAVVVGARNLVCVTAKAASARPVGQGKKCL